MLWMREASVAFPRRSRVLLREPEARLQTIFCLGADAPNERARTLHAHDQVDGFAGPDHRGVEVALTCSGLIRDTLDVQR